MLKITCLLLIVALMLQVSRAWDEGNNEEEQLAAARQQSDEYFANAFSTLPLILGIPLTISQALEVNYRTISFDLCECLSLLREPLQDVSLSFLFFLFN